MVVSVAQLMARHARWHTVERSIPGTCHPLDMVHRRLAVLGPGDPR